jgi:hypothetical protein
MKSEPKESAPDVVKTTIRIRRDLWNATLHRSIDENLSQQEIVERALEAYLKKGGRR